MKKMLIVDSLDDSYLPLLKSMDYERYEVDFDPETEPHKLIDAIAACDALLFAEGLNWGTGKYIYAMAKWMKKPCLFPNVPVVEAEYVERLVQKCTEACETLQGELRLLPSRLPTRMWGATDTLLIRAQELTDWMICHMPYLMPDWYEIEHLVIHGTKDGCRIELPTKTICDFGTTTIEYNYLKEIMAKAKKVTFDGDSDLIRRLKNARGTKGSQAVHS